MPLSFNRLALRRAEQSIIHGIPATDPATLDARLLLVVPVFLVVGQCRVFSARNYPLVSSQRDTNLAGRCASGEVKELKPSSCRVAVDGGFESRYGRNGCANVSLNESGHDWPRFLLQMRPGLGADVAMPAILFVGVLKSSQERIWSRVKHDQNWNCAGSPTVDGELILFTSSPLTACRDGHAKFEFVRQWKATRKCLPAINLPSLGDVLRAFNNFGASALGLAAYSRRQNGLE